MTVRAADPSESAALTALAFAAKALWGYGTQQLDAWSTELQISPESIATQPTHVAEVQGRVLGVVQLNTSSTPWQIECLWVHPEATRQGIGARLVREAIAHARAQGQLQLHVDADPHAEAFYQHLGARRVGAVPAPIAGNAERVRPQLVLGIEPPRPESA